MNGKPNPSNTQPSISSALAAARQCLSGISDTAALDAYVLLAHVVEKDKAWLLAHSKERLTSEQFREFDGKLGELVEGTPLPYVIGEWEFFGLNFFVTPDVLIPRPETELLVETALEWLNRNRGKYKVAEAGTGSGCISVSLAVNSPKLQITATDISPQALAIARKNAAMHQIVDQITFLQNDLLIGLSGPYDLICANLPYIPTAGLQELAVSRREPRLALDGGEDGLDLIRQLLDQAENLLTASGMILMEIEQGQGEQVLQLAQEKISGAAVEVIPDLAGKQRLLVAER